MSKRINKTLNNNSYLNDNSSEVNLDVRSINNGIVDVLSYDENCEEHSKISKIICLKEVWYKKVIVWTLNIVTFFIIQLIFSWFPNFKISLNYSRTNNPKEADYFAVYSNEDDNTNANIYNSSKYKYNSSNNSEVSIIKKKHVDLKKYNSEIDYLRCYFECNFFEEEDLCILSYKLFNYIYLESRKAFFSIKYDIKSNLSEVIENMNQGLSENERNYFFDIIGLCFIKIDVKSIPTLIFEEISDPFYIFQLFSVILWFGFEQYYAYAVIIVVSTVASISIGVIETLQNLKGIRDIAEFSALVNRKVKGKENLFEKVDSKYLAPGDVIELPEETKVIPCDSILINGTAVINESVLTGESTPIMKSDLSDSKSYSNVKFSEFKNNPNFTKHYLFTGTKLIQKRGTSKESKCLAIVLKTGYNSEKGNMIRSILNPKEKDKDLKSESMKYILIMFIVTVIIYVIVIPFMDQKSFANVFVKFLDMITVGVPPALPACMGIGITFAIKRLKKGNIICVKRERTNIAGQINYIVFDKTGTLTMDNLDKYGCVNAMPNLNCSYKETENLGVELNNTNSSKVFKKRNNRFLFKPFISANNNYSSVFNNEETRNYINKFNLDYNSNLMNLDTEINYLREECFATCHSLTLLDNNIIGDPIEQEMFSSSDWELNELGINTDLKAIVNPKKDKEFKVGVLKIFDFISKLQRMSVITKVLNYNKDSISINLYKLYTKGSPEKLMPLCIPVTIPKNYDKILKDYTSKGLRVLGIAAKLIKTDNIEYYSREQAEKNLIFLGFYIVQNKLKKETTPEIHILRKSDLKMYMATGDNILTASFIGQQCSLVNTDILTLELQSRGDIQVNKIEIKKADPIFNKEDDSDRSNNDNNSSKELNESILKGQNIEDNNYTDIDSKIDINASYTDNKNYSPFILKPEEVIIGNNKNKDTVFLSNDSYKTINLINQNKEDKVINDCDNNIYTRDIMAKVADFLSNLNLDDTTLSYAMDGHMFECLIQMKSNEFIDAYVKELIQKLICEDKCIIYARMTPEMKANLVREIQKSPVYLSNKNNNNNNNSKNAKKNQLNKNQNIVMMCGDGANDCAALKIADVGVSLSLEDASIAAPFTSTLNNISTLKKLLREGKASLVTSFQCFKFMILYSMIVLISGAILLACKTYLTDYEFLIVDAALVFPFATLVGLTGACKPLNRALPTKSLLSVSVVVSILSELLVCTIAMFLALFFLRQQKWYVEYKPPKDNNMLSEVESNWENTVIFTLSFAQIIIVGFALTTSKPFKKSIATNILLSIFLVVMFILAIEYILYPDPISLKLLQLDRYPQFGMNVIVFIIAACNLAISMYIEEKLVPLAVKIWDPNSKEFLDEKELDLDRIEYDKIQKRIKQLDINIDNYNTDNEYYY